MSDVPAYEVLEWAEQTFGPVARDRHERACRFLEEAIELAQAEGLTNEMVTSIALRVFSCPAGNTAKEVGQAMMTLNCLAWNSGLDAGAEERREWDRVRSIPKDEWERRHKAKVQLGIAG